jgi:hypothetical protein
VIQATTRNVEGLSIRQLGYVIARLALLFRPAAARCQVSVLGLVQESLLLPITLPGRTQLR